VQFLAWLAVFTVALTSLGHKARDFLPSFVILYALSVAIFTLGQWDQAKITSARDRNAAKTQTPESNATFSGSP
jgi:hypothetical protein